MRKSRFPPLATPRLTLNLRGKSHSELQTQPLGLLKSSSNLVVQRKALNILGLNLKHPAHDKATSQYLLLAVYKYPRVQKEVHYRSSSLSFTSLHKTCTTFRRYSELLLDMMFFAFTSSALAIILLALSTRDTEAYCLPCQPPSKRVNIAWAASIPISRRGVWSPKITSPTPGTVWTGNENVRVTWYVLLFRFHSGV